MNINEPTISRILAILIKNIDIEDRRTFLNDAEKSANMEEFISGMSKYKTYE